MLQHYPDPGIDCRVADSRRWWQAITMPELRIVISGDALEIFMFERQWWPGGHRKLLQHQQYPLAGNAQESLPPEACWQTLNEVLTPLAGQRWHIVIVVSDQYSRWLVLPWQAEIRSKAERQAYYSHGLQQAFGPQLFSGEMQDWDVQSQAGAYGKHVLINAMPRGLTEKLHTLFAEHRLRPGMIAPAWMLSANQALHHMRRQKLPQDGWIISRESGSLTVACLLQGEWQQIRYLPIDGQWRDSLHQYLLREQVMHAEWVSLPVYLPQAQWSGISGKALSPFTLVDVQPELWLGDAFHQQLRRRLA
ncbi:MAG: hypothetical protein ACAH08_03470 [Methylophilus sp.]